MENEAVVSMALASVKVTMPGPLNWVQVTMTVDGSGRPSSVTVASRLALAGSTMVWSSPASTTGGSFTAVTVKTAPSLSLASPGSVAVKTIVSLPFQSALGMPIVATRSVMLTVSSMFPA